MYKTLFLISGSLRTFRENITYLPENCEIAVFISPDDDDTYFNNPKYDFVFKDKRIKTLLLEYSILVPNEFTEQRQINNFKQWYKLNRLFNAVPSTYDHYVRLRPDIQLLDKTQLEDLLKIKTNTLRIPLGNDRNGINDQLCIGSYTEMKHYCSLIEILSQFVGSPAKNLSKFTSEEILKSYINIPIERVQLDYKLLLSSAKIIAISGDSGSGKTTLSNLIKPLFFFDKALEFETDRYHRWDRHSEHWKNTTHLNPNANYLEKLEDDTFNLKLGRSIIAVDYDHSTGKFTPPERIEPAENILLCGLHTLYSDKLRDMCDLKIFMNTDEAIKTEWKLKRDERQRCQTKYSILDKIKSRISDYERYIAPQKNHADVIISFSDSKLVISILTEKDPMKLGKLASELNNSNTWTTYTFSEPSLCADRQIYEFTQSKGLPLIEVKPGYFGILQFTMLTLLYI